MKKQLLIMLCWLIPFGSMAQNNKETKRQAEQIAYLKIYAELIKKGYKIAREGLDLIGDIKNKDFLQHKNYFKSLATASGAVRKNPKAAEISELGKRALIAYYRDWPKIRASQYLTETEKQYVSGVFERMLEDCQQQLQELETLLTDDLLVMKDGERLARMDLIRQSMTDCERLLRQFSYQALFLHESRKKQQEISILIYQL
jgi:hypothetical protein